MQVAVVGRIQTRNFENQQGQKVYVTEVVAEETYFADSKKEEKTFPPAGDKAESKPSFTESFVDNGDDLPF